MIIPHYSKGHLTTPDGARLSYVMIGTGLISVTVIPGAGDGLTTVEDSARRLALYYRARAASYRILALSRRQPIPPGYRMDQHADDMIWAWERLNWGPTILECNSAGGPVGQWMAVKWPDLVRGLILSCTLHYTPEHTRRIIEHWYVLARQRRWRELNWSSIEYTFTPRMVARYRLARPFLFLLGGPRDPERLERVLEPLLTLDNRPILPRITCPALVIGGADDKVIPAEVQREMAELIPDSRLKLYPGYGHGNDQENTQYNVEVERFAREVEAK
jgi:pimeloyl-ACP methyl ester carboxylesterase